MLVDQIKLLDIVPNYTDTYASLDKQKIDEKMDFDENEEIILRNQIDRERGYKTERSNEVFKTQIVSFSIIISQIILFLVIFMTPKMAKKQEQL